MLRLVLLALAALAALATPSVAEPIRGAGSTFAAPIINKWSQMYRQDRSYGLDLSGAVSGAGVEGGFKQEEANIEYEAIGSGGGISRITQSGLANFFQAEADFGLTDTPLTPEDLKRFGLAQFPVVMGGIVPVVNIQGVGPGVIRFTGPLLADIFLGKIQSWSDPAIKAINPDVTLPDQKIAVVHRVDGSGTTYNFARFLASVSPEWQSKVGVDIRLKWPVGTGADGNSGIVRAVRETPGAISYVEYGQVSRAALSYGLVQNRSGNFIRPDTGSFQAAAASADWANAKDFYLYLTDAPGPQAYPIAATVFALMPTNANARRTRRALEFFQLGLEKGAAEALALGYVPLPEPLVKQVKAHWATVFKVSM